MPIVPVTAFSTSGSSNGESSPFIAARERAFRQAIGTAPAQGQGKNVGKTLSIESRAKISLAKKGVSIGPHSEETKSKISCANRGKVRSREMKEAMGKEWKLLSPEGIIIVLSLRTFCVEMNLGYTSLMNTLRTKKPIAKGPTAGWMILA